jgi:hypothetical protein
VNHIIIISLATNLSVRGIVMYYYTTSVLELCGGDMKSVSEIELAKRTDLR